jgi:hypothetical protein
VKGIFKKSVCVLVIGLIVFVVAYSNKTACPGVAVYVKCKNFLED